MLELIWLLPTFPLLGFLALVLTGGRLPMQIAGPIGAGSIGLSFAVAALVASEFLNSGLKASPMKRGSGCLSADLTRALRFIWMAYQW